jgi:cytochrome b6-f complex iron-sulfur subunit
MKNGGLGPVGRRPFLGTLLVLLLAPFAFIWRSMAKNRTSAAAHRSIRIATPKADGVSFHGPVILRKTGAQLIALSARCPHLGCHIERVEGDSLICPCHGSKFSLQGKRLLGPSQKDLPRLPIRQEDGGATIVIQHGG